MSDGEEFAERQLSRDKLLRIAAAAGGAVLLPGSLAAAAKALTAETGRLQVLDWAGYGNDGGQSMFAQYVKAHASNKPQFTVHDERVGRAREDPRRATSPICSARTSGG